MEHQMATPEPPVVAHECGAAADAGDAAAAPAELEEVTFPPSVPALTPHPADTALGPGGRLRIEQLLGAAGRVNRYLAVWEDDEGQPLQVEVREGPAAHEGLRREAEVLTAVRYAMLPKLYAAFEQDGRRYLALERVDGDTLEQ